MDGIGIAATAIGAIFIYGGIKGYSPLKAFGNLLTGQNPNQGQSASLLSSSTNSSGPDFTVTSGGDANANKTLAKQLANQMGHVDWTSGQMWADWDALWTQESGWRVDATNPQSGAYGIPQSLPASKMASAGSDWKTNPATQIKWGIQYIAGTYGNPSNAEAHERANNWY